MARTLVYVIADFGPLGDLAYAEVVQRLYADLDADDFEIQIFPVPAFDTVATGFFLAQTAINSKLGKKHKFYVNTAPRKDNLEARAHNSGESLAYAKLFNDVEIVAVNSGYSLSFIKDAAVDIRGVNVTSAGSQFRSRDVFPAPFIAIAKGDYSGLTDDWRDDVPDMPQASVYYTDGYGNLKCGIDPATLKPGAAMITIEGKTQSVRITDGIFGVKDGEFSFAAGSSGWTLPNGKKLKFAEIVKRGGSAAEAFGKPRGGTKVEWQAAN